MSRSLLHDYPYSSGDNTEIQSPIHPHLSLNERDNYVKGHGDYMMQILYMIIPIHQVATQRSYRHAVPHLSLNERDNYVKELQRQQKGYPAIQTDNGGITFVLFRYRFKRSPDYRRTPMVTISHGPASRDSPPAAFLASGAASSSRIVVL